MNVPERAIEEYTRVLSKMFITKLDEFVQANGRDANPIERRKIKASCIDTIGSYPNPMIQAVHPHVLYHEQRMRAGWPQGKGAPSRSTENDSFLIGSKVMRMVIGQQIARGKRMTKKAESNFLSPTYVLNEKPRLAKRQEKNRTGNALLPQTKYRRLIERTGFAPSDSMARMLLAVDEQDLKAIRRELEKEFVFEQMTFPELPTMIGYYWRVTRKVTPPIVPQPDKSLAERAMDAITNAKAEDLRALIDLLAASKKD